MTAALSILLPIFALILAGFVCRRAGVLGPTAASELNRFVVWLGLPALLFGIVARSSWSQLYQPDVIAPFGLATGAVFAAVYWLRRRSGRAVADAGVEAVAASYSNAGFIGFPLAYLVFGPDSQASVTLATMLVVCVLFAIAVIIVRAGLQGGRLGAETIAAVLGSLARNPLIVAPLAGVVVAALGLAIPAPVDTWLKLLGGAASPVALVSLGLFLAEKRDSSASRHVPLMLTGIKLVALPLATWVLAVGVFHVPRATAQLVVLLSALPTGTGPYMLAEFYRREAVVTSQTILWSTVLSLVTLSLLLAAFPAMV